VTAADLVAGCRCSNLAAKAFALAFCWAETLEDAPACCCSEACTNQLQVHNSDNVSKGPAVCILPNNQASERAVGPLPCGDNRLCPMAMLSSSGTGAARSQQAQSTELPQIQRRIQLCQLTSESLGCFLWQSFNAAIILGQLIY
jgi:hypothetical protein